MDQVVRKTDPSGNSRPRNQTCDIWGVNPLPKPTLLPTWAHYVLILSANKSDELIAKSELSNDQAAINTQSMYWRWQERKLQPLRKLREIAKIRYRMGELKQEIVSPEFEGELGGDDKTKEKMSRTLMGLLLLLDTIQGLHPVVRNARYLARELVRLQDKYDTIVEEACSSHFQKCMMYKSD